MMPAPPITLDEILSKCFEEGDCWVWGGSMSSDGRPLWNTTHKRCIPVRRLVLELRSGRPMPAGRYASCTCNTRGCVWHAVALTRSQHMKKAGREGRLGGPKHAAALALAKRRTGKMNPEKVQRLKQMREAGATYHQLAAEFQIHFSLAHRICTGKAWAPVAGASVFTFRPPGGGL